MTEEYITTREREFLDYLRNNIEDPSNRGTDVIDETFIATDGQTDFILENVLVKNVADTITVNGVTKRKGYDYYVTYGEGKTGTTTVTLLTEPSEGTEVLISYHYGPSMVEREWSRTDSILPRIVIHFVHGDEVFAALGDLMEGQKGSYFDVTYRIEIRDRYANRARLIMSKCFNLIRKMRQLSLFRTNIVRAGGTQNFDFDPEKDAYIWQFTADIQWEIMYE